MRVLTFGVCAALLVTGCAASVPTMRKADMATFPQDDWICTRDVETALGNPTGGMSPAAAIGYVAGRSKKFAALYRQCMEAQGYAVARD